MSSPDSPDLTADTAGQAIPETADEFMAWLKSDTVETLFGQARDADDPKVQRALAKAENAVQALREVFEPWAAEQQAAAERTAKLAEAQTRADQLRAELEQVNTQIAGLTGGRRTSKSSKAASRRRSQEIRAWAAAQGIKVNPTGRVPDEVVKKYEAAHPQEPGDAAG